MTLQAKLWCLSNDCLCLRMIFIETESLWRMRNTITFPVQQNFISPKQQDYQQTLRHQLFREPFPMILSNFWTAFPRDAPSHSPYAVQALCLVSFLLMNCILLLPKNLCCPLKIPLNVLQAASLPQYYLYLSPSIVVPAYIYPATQITALLCLRTLQQTQSVPCIISWGWTPISYDGLKTACLGKVNCKYT